MKNIGNDLVKNQEIAVRTSAPFGTEPVKGTAPKGRPYALLRGWFLLIALVILTLGLSALPVLGLADDPINVTKSWLDAEGNPVSDGLPDNVTVRLTRERSYDEPIPDGEVTLFVKDIDYDATDWSHTGEWHKGFSFQRGTVATITWEYNPGFNPKEYSINGGPAHPLPQNEGTGSFTVTIPETGVLQVVFSDGWGHTEFKGVTAAGIAPVNHVTEEDPDYSDTMTLSAAGGWQGSVNVPFSETIGDKDYSYTYYISEDPIDGWAASYSDNALTESGTVEIINAQTISVSAQKVWADENGTPVAWPSDVTGVELKLQRRTGTGTFRDVESCEHQEVTAQADTVTFANLASLDDGGAPYEYRVVEAHPIEGYLPGETTADGTHFIVTNKSMQYVTVSMDKIWNEDSVTSGMAWEATFRLEELEYPYSQVNGQPDYDPEAAYEDVESGSYMGDAWHPVTPATTWTVQSWVPGSFQMPDLPKFRVKEDGSIVILMYSVTETGYRVWADGDTTQDPIYSLVSDEFSGDILFAPEYLEDASDYTNYEIQLRNGERRQRHGENINFDLTKQWISGNDTEDPASDSSTYAVFQLKRYVHEEYKKLDDPEVDYNEFVTIKIVDGGGRTLTSMQVEKGAMVKLQAAFHAGTSGNVVFVNLNDPSDHVQITGSALPYQHLCTSDSFRVYEDVTYRYSSGSERLADGLAGVVISDRCDGAPTADAEDAAFTGANYRYRVDNSTGWRITYDNGTVTAEQTTDAWKIEFVNFPQTVINTGLNRETTYVYGYYFDEVEAYPGASQGYRADYYAADASGNPTNIENGTEENRIYFDGSVIAENEKKFLLVKKYWEAQVQENMPNVVVDIKKVPIDGAGNFVG